MVGQVEQELAYARQIIDPRVRDQHIERIAERLRASDVAAGVAMAPDLLLATADFDRDVTLILADRYWRLRFLDEPWVETALTCGQWLDEHTEPDVHRPILEKWAKGYAFITRNTVEETVELTVDGHPDPEARYFAAVYHAAKLKFSFQFPAMVSFWEEVTDKGVVDADRAAEPLWIALYAAALYGDPKVDSNFARVRLDEAWKGIGSSYHVADVCLSALRYARPFPDQGQLLRRFADQALELYPGEHVFLADAATGRYMTAELDPVDEADGRGDEADRPGDADLDEALTLIQQALAAVPAIGNRNSYELFQSQYMAKRDAIVDARIHHKRIIRRNEELRKKQRELDGEVNRVKAVMASNEEQNRANQVRSVELVAVFSAVIAFAVGAFQVTTAGEMDLGDRLILLVVWGLLNVVFVGLVVLGTWWIAGRRDSRDDDDDTQAG